MVSSASSLQPTHSGLTGGDDCGDEEEERESGEEEEERPFSETGAKHSGHPGHPGEPHSEGRKGGVDDRGVAGESGRPIGGGDIHGGGAGEADWAIGEARATEEEA